MFKFRDRIEAGYSLAKVLIHYKNLDALILAIPRGGVPIGKIVADELGLPLEVILSKKIGLPTQKEYAIGAVSLVGSVVNPNINVSEYYIKSETKRIQDLLQQRYKNYYKDRVPLSLKDKIVIIVDDGIATGFTLLSTIQMIRQQSPYKVVVAVPVASPRGVEWLKEQIAIDEVIVLLAPDNFQSVGQFYETFEQVTDQEVDKILSSSHKPPKERPNPEI